MDYHHLPGITLEEIKHAHLADKRTEAKYGVKCLQFWVNKEAGTVFCLLEAPDKKACIDTHQEAHGGIACNIIDVDPIMLKLFIGSGKYVEHGIVHTSQGLLDPGHRYILILDLTVKTNFSDSNPKVELPDPNISKTVAKDIVKGMNGKVIEDPGRENLTALFEESNQVLKCALALHKEFSARVDIEMWNVEFRIAINYGQPVTMKEGLFSETLVYTNYLSLIANNREIIVPGAFKNLAFFDKLGGENRPVKIVTEKYQPFVKNFFRHMENNFSDGSFSVSALSSEIGVSRPQLYRIMMKITGRSPATFIRYLKMHKALSLIREENLNICQIAFELGYNNPSYFSKCFHERFGVMPSKIKI